MKKKKKSRSKAKISKFSEEERTPKIHRPKGKRIELNSRELRVNLEKLQEDMKKVYGTMKKIIPESITDKEIRAFGNASHIILPKKYAGKKATVIIRNGK